MTLVTIRHILFTMIALTTACASPGSKSSDGKTLHNAIVKEVSKPAVLSGVIATFTEVRIDHDGQLITLLFPYMETNENLPNVGDQCDFSYEDRSINGLTSVRSLKGEVQKVLVAFECGHQTRNP